MCFLSHQLTLNTFNLFLILFDREQMTDECLALLILFSFMKIFVFVNHCQRFELFCFIFLFEFFFTSFILGSKSRYGSSVNLIKLVQTILETIKGRSQISLSLMIF